MTSFIIVTLSAFLVLIVGLWMTVGVVRVSKRASAEYARRSPEIVDSVNRCIDQTAATTRTVTGRRSRLTEGVKILTPTPVNGERRTA